MRKNVKKVIEAFLLHKSAVGDSKKTISTDGNVIYSYAMQIAWRVNGTTVNLVPYEKGPSRTTRSQIRACEIMFPLHFEHIIREELIKQATKQIQILEPGDLVRVKDSIIDESYSQHWSIFDAQDHSGPINREEFRNQIGEIYIQPDGTRAVWWPTLNGYNFFINSGLELVHKKSKG